MSKHNININEIVSSLVKVKLVIGGSCAGEIRAAELTRETARQHGANERDFNLTVKWLNKEHRTMIGSAASRLRDGFNRRTLPWEDGGYRAIPADAYQSLCDFIAQAGEDYHAAGKKVCDEWDSAMSEARARLNGAFDKIAIPSREQFEVGVRYDFRSDVIVAPADMRISGIAEATIERIRQQARADYQARIDCGVRAMLSELSVLLKDLIERTDKDNQQGIRYGGWAEWAKRLVGHMKPLNITNDTSLTALMNKVMDIANSMDAEAMRANASARRAVKKQAADALDVFGLK